jgi:hypothetical protein
MTGKNREYPLSFQMLLASFALMLFVPGLFQGDFSSLISRFLFTLILLSSLYIVANRRKDLIVGVALALPAVVTNWAPDWFFDLKSQVLTYSFFQTVFLIYIVARISRYLVAARKVDAEIIYAAICLYLLLGVTWTMMYFGVVLIDPLAINLKVDTDFADRESMTVVLHELIYFSYVTQTTLGYGDLTPVTGIARALVIAQSLLGQIYIAVIIARLVGLQIADGMNESFTDTAGDKDDV